jgi:hypothetical protein
MRSGVIVILAIIVALFFFSRGTDGSTSSNSGSGSDSSTTGHLSVVPTIRSVTVSPGSVEFGNCSGGNGATNSTDAALGYPNGLCSVGIVNEKFPITVAYSGLPGQVYVQSSNAVPSDGGTQWALCSPPAGGSQQPRTTCSGTNGLPGTDQYMIQNFAEQVSSATVLDGSAACDEEFDPAGGCSATPSEFAKQTQHEGLLLTGPASWDDHSTSWTMTITWYAHGS